jgi:M6 family metalloprotease-like protein
MKRSFFLLALLTLAAQRPVLAATTSLNYRPGTNTLSLLWDGKLDTALQYADDPVGPWKTVFGAKPPYATPTTRPHRYYRLGPGLPDVEGYEGQPAPGKQTFASRTEPAMGNWRFFPQSDWMPTRGRTWTRIRSGERHGSPLSRSMSGNFLVERDNTPVAISFSAEAYVEPTDRRMFVRAKVDGTVVEPADVVFTTGTSAANPETRSFIFTTTLNAGLHTLEMEWLVDRDSTGYVRDATFLVRQGESGGAGRRFIIVNPPSGNPSDTTSSGWTTVPGLTGSVETKAGDSLAISVSAESYTQAGGSLFLRALVDGVPAKPSDVLFAKGSKPQSRMMTFGLSDPAPGVHNVTIQWQVSGGGSGHIGDRSLVLTATAKSGSGLAQVFASPASGPPEVIDSTSFKPMPGMRVSGALPANADIAVFFSAVLALPNGESVFARLTIDDVPVPDSEVQLAESDTHVGTHSHVFTAKQVYQISAPASSTLRVEWRTAHGQAVSLDDRSMTVLVKRTSVPDLAEPMPFGGGNSPTEVAFGPHAMVTILFDPRRAGIPKPNLAATKAAIYGPNPSVRHYYQTVSNGRFTLENALGGDAVLGWYDGTNGSSTYFNGGKGCVEDGAPNGSDRRRREAIGRASEDFNFAAYDLNGDGVVDPKTELAVLIILPDDGTSGTAGQVRPVYDENCDPLVVQGVIVPSMAECIVPMTDGQFIIPAHEMAHLLFAMDDAYVSNAINTRTRRLSLMDSVSAEFNTHIDPVNKLALGWVNPRIIQADGNYSLRDVKKSHEIIVLPRLPASGRDEYYLLENRQNAANDTLYDRNIIDSGIAVWHVVSDNGINGVPPVCQEPVAWAAEVDSWNTRRGLRVLRPQIVSDNANTLWSNEHYDLLDTGLVCASEDGGYAPNRRNVLQWADGTASGYNILHWSAAAETMTFQIVVP